MEKKILGALCKGFIPLLLFMCSLNTFAQEMRFVQTSSIDQYGNRHGPSNYGSMEIKLKVNDDEISMKSGMLTFRWRYHHSEGGNYIYYLVAKDYISGREILNDQSVIVAAPDFSIINMIDKLWTLIYEHKERNYGTLAR